MINKKFDKKAWIRILEAFLAILIIMGAVLVIINKESVKSDISDEVYQKQRQILDVISKNDSLREKIIIGENKEVNDTIYVMLPKNWNFSTRICELNKICNADTPSDYERDIYTTEIIITSNLTQYSPKKLSFFVWSK